MQEKKRDIGKRGGRTTTNNTYREIETRTHKRISASPPLPTLTHPPPPPSKWPFMCLPAENRSAPPCVPAPSRHAKSGRPRRPRRHGCHRHRSRSLPPPPQPQSTPPKVPHPARYNASGRHLTVARWALERLNCPPAPLFLAAAVSGRPHRPRRHWCHRHRSRRLCRQKCPTLPVTTPLGGT